MYLKINNCKWEIKECSLNDAPLSDGKFYGRTYFFDKIIYLNKDSSLEQKQKTLRHELTHAYLQETQIFYQEENIKFTEEMLCEFVGHYGGEIENIVLKYMNLRH